MLGFACGLAFGSVASCSAAAAPWQDSDCKTSSCGNSSCKMLQIGGERSEIFKALAVLHGISHLETPDAKTVTEASSCGFPAFPLTKLGRTEITEVQLSPYMRPQQPRSHRTACGEPPHSSVGHRSTCGGSVFLISSPRCEPHYAAKVRQNPEDSASLSVKPPIRPVPRADS